MAVIAVLAIIIMASRSEAATSGYPAWIHQDGITYTAYNAEYVVPPERWRYAILDDATCDASVFIQEGPPGFSGGTRNDIVYSNSYTLDKNDLVDLNGQYICFNAYFNGDRMYVSTQFEWDEWDGLTEIESYHRYLWEFHGCDSGADLLSFEGDCILRHSPLDDDNSRPNDRSL